MHCALRRAMHAGRRALSTTPAPQSQSRSWVLGVASAAAGAAGACTKLEPAPPGDHWCGASHNQGEYTSDDAVTLVDLGLAQQPSRFRLGSYGWRLCGANLQQCQQACVALGDCAELSMASNGCCFPATEACDGTKRTKDSKYQATEC